MRVVGIAGFGQLAGGFLAICAHRIVAIPSDSKAAMEEASMRPREPVADGQRDLFRARLGPIIALDHSSGAAGADRLGLPGALIRHGLHGRARGRPPLLRRPMAGLAILKHMHDLSDEALCERWVENPYFQFFCGEEFFRHEPPFDRSSLTRWRQWMGEERLTRLDLLDLIPGNWAV